MMPIIGVLGNVLPLILNVSKPVTKYLEDAQMFEFTKRWFGLGRPKVKRTIWVWECCGERDVDVHYRGGERLCKQCHKWVEWKEVSAESKEYK